MSSVRVALSAFMLLVAAPQLQRNADGKPAGLALAEPCALSVSQPLAVVRAHAL